MRNWKRIFGREPASSISLPVIPAGQMIWDFAFRCRTELCRPFTKKYIDPSASYDGYEEDDDTKEGARTIPLKKI